MDNSSHIKKQNSFYITDTRLLFFDIFYKNNKIYMIMPIYNKPVNPSQINIIINNNELSLSESFVKNSDEPSLIYVYNVPIISEDIESEIDVEVTCCEITKKYNLKHITNSTNSTLSNKYFLTLTTLFKNDYHIFPLFYNYYISQGVSHFYMYYNGIITKDIQNFFEKYSKDVTLIEWNFHYWNPRTFKYPHHAQTGQIHHAIYKYGKSNSEYMIFCDLDEYLHIPISKNKDNCRFTLKQYIENHPDIDIFGFCNIWANTINNEYPSISFFPDKIFIVEDHNEYCDRSKNIYKLDSIQTIGIHQVATSEPSFINEKLKSIVDLKMYHFYNWSRSSRTIEKCKILTYPKL